MTSYSYLFSLLLKLRPHFLNYDTYYKPLIRILIKEKCVQYDEEFKVKRCRKLDKPTPNVKCIDGFH